MVKTLKRKITIVYLGLVLLIAIVGAVSVLNVYSLSKSVNGLMTDNYKSINAVYNMLEAIERQDSAFLTYVNIDKQKGIDLFTDNNDIFYEWYNFEYTNITEPGERSNVDKIGEYYKEYAKLFPQIQEIYNNEGAAKAVDFYNSEATVGLTRMKQELKNLVMLNEKAMFDKKNNVTDSTRKTVYILTLLSIVAVFGGILLSRFSTNRLLMPIYSLRKAIRMVKAGNLNEQIDNISQDEVGELAIEFNDMTKRLQQYEQSTLGQILTEKNKSVAIVKSITDPLIVLDVNYKIVLLNNACENFFNIKEGKVIGKHFLEAIQNGELFEHILSVFNSKADHKEKIIYIKTDDDYYFNVVVTTVKDINADITGLIVVLQNVTKLKKLERIKTDFVATISHEFKTPLTSIIMGTSMIFDESMGVLNNEQKSVISTIREDEMRLSNLVNELLELSKIESDRAIFNIELCSMREIIEVSIKQFSEQAQVKDISLYYIIEDNLPKVYADFEKITWVINNLVTNALKYTSAGDKIYICANVINEKMRVSVNDTGAGIPSDFINKIFDKFVQVKGYDMEVRGTGLGLAIVKEIINAHKGEIWCESELNKGSTFTFTLPLDKGEEA